MKRIISLAMLLLAIGVVRAFSQCPPNTLGVDPVCLAAGAYEPWVQVPDRVIKLSEHCYALVTYCRRWVCRGYAGKSASQMSISKIALFSDQGGPGTGEGCYPDIANDNNPNWHQDLQDRIELVIRKGIEQDVWRNDGRPRLCTDPIQDVLFEVVHGSCVTEGGWYGLVSFDNGASWKNLFGTVISFCEGEVACINRYVACCTDPLKTHVTMTRIGTDVLSLSGVPLTPPYSHVCHGTGTDFPALGQYTKVGVGNPAYGGVGAAVPPGQTYEDVYSLGQTFKFNVDQVTPITACTFHCGNIN
jgi:hypothetical protein